MEKTSANIFGNCLIILLLCITCRTNAQNGDINILKDINLNRNKSLDNGMATLTNSVYPLSAALPISELVTGYARHDKQLITKGWTTVAAVGTNFIVTFGLKYSVNRTRPYITYPELQPYKHNKDASFPSGHTSFSFNTATSLTILFPKWYVAVPAYAWAGSVGYSRMYLGMHYPTDVLAGAIIGAGTAILADKGNKWLQHHRKKTAHIEH